ncbi:hypothetical protein CAPTEDRAFT_191818 [Capitella teleta]|uniref:Uncharacterized protein n=1 Tax=Capitella teleta TaxID=283909 RepID=R7TXY1_CAPTE|nr:hypothetical protein CAPTEDRAFT_191818 [Capitella teleta]|eukprot:ELT98773.1 hypothetical protein CAPTEDRAFT_191818 [Capitella teleta]
MSAPPAYYADCLEEWMQDGFRTISPVPGSIEKEKAPSAKEAIRKKCSAPYSIKKISAESIRKISCVRVKAARQRQTPPQRSSFQCKRIPMNEIVDVPGAKIYRRKDKMIIMIVTPKK